MAAPVVFIRGVPQDIREWDRALADLNRTLVKGRSRVYLATQRSLNPVTFANKHSVQSANPLTATDAGGGLAEIQVAAHTLTDSEGTISYGSGTISGLANSIQYFVYTDDPESAGGAVSYSATTNFQSITANKGRYYVGKITTPAGGGGGTQGGWGGGGGGNGFPLP
jgi:hypothetical protein